MGAVRNAYKIVVIIVQQSCEDLHFACLLNSKSCVEVVKAKMFVFSSMFQEI